MQLQISNLSKRYSNGFEALKNINLDIENGVLGLLGPNGAGKSTLMKILATLSKPSQGEVLWNGVDIVKKPGELRAVLGYLPQYFGVYDNLSAQEFLEYIAAVKGINSAAAQAKIAELLNLVNLVDVAKRPLGKYSGGMKQRVGIAQALLNDPLLLIVDEPTVGLDPEERLRFRSLIGQIAAERIVIFSTHIVSDIEAVATTLAVLAEGKLLSYSAPEELLKSVEGKVWEVKADNQELNKLTAAHIISNTTRKADGLLIRLIADQQPDQALAVTPNLEDAYLYLIESQHKQA